MNPRPNAIEAINDSAFPKDSLETKESNGGIVGSFIARIRSRFDQLTKNWTFESWKGEKWTFSNWKRPKQ